MSELIPYFSAKTGLTEWQIDDLLRTAPNRYRSFYIAKAGGEKRLISTPSKELKILQRALVELLSPRLAIHRAATAFRKGSSIKTNASAHSGNAAIRNYDFEDFFPSLVASDWVGYCGRKSVFVDDEDVEA